ncbi:flavodoxin [Bacillus norwichensis]|uniref:Flavodoxin n=1 Tax=Bacillus norwichensis TaxID=2762217 RepID=A0ABR8VRE4_9BACI|nr:flavodoxin [Bacillus norwichensis]MBD8007317.1 flavodoxin [Bacillus norwichensis]
MVRILICYASFSGNTKETADIINKVVSTHGHSTVLYRIGSGPVPDPSLFDAIMIGTFTWGKGATPDLVKDFVYEIGYKPPNVYVFGTGDTQFGGDDLFCHAAEKLAAFYHSPFETLKIEQSPRGSQENIVKNWTEGVLNQCLKHLKK